jgi:hypothetical protein
MAEPVSDGVTNHSVITRQRAASAPSGFIE